MVRFVVGNATSLSMSCWMGEVVFLAELCSFKKFTAMLSAFSSSVWGVWDVEFWSRNIWVFSGPVVLKFWQSV